jgi:hypothetical protein
MEACLEGLFVADPEEALRQLLEVTEFPTR